MSIKTILTYPILVLLSTGKKNFSNMGPVIQRGGDTVKRLLRPAEVSFAQLEYIAKFMFSWQRTLYFSIDDTLLKKASKTLAKEEEEEEVNLKRRVT